MFDFRSIIKDIGYCCIKMCNKKVRNVNTIQMLCLIFLKQQNVLYRHISDLIQFLSALLKSCSCSLGKFGYLIVFELMNARS